MSEREALADVLLTVIADHPAWIGDNGEPLDYLPEREARISDLVREQADAALAHIAAVLRDEATVEAVTLTYPAQIGRSQRARQALALIAERLGVPHVDR
jgi:hypothetical protein